MSDLISMLEGMSQDEIAKLKTILGVKTTPKKRTTKKKPAKTAKKRTSQPKEDGLVVLNKNKPESKKRRKVEIEEDLDDVEVKHRGNSKGAACYTERITAGKRENKFLKMAESKAYKNDTIIDKKLHKNRSIIPRERPSPMKKVRCFHCGDVYEVNVSILPLDSETKRPKFICNNCQIERRGV